MPLKIIVENQPFAIEVPPELIDQAGSFFDQMDRDMDAGWQMSREWVAQPDRLQRCQIVANKLLTAMEKDNPKLVMLMGGYLLSRLPGLESLDIDTQGEMTATRFIFAEEPPATAPAPLPTPETARRPPMNKMEALAQASQDVTKVFKVGQLYRFSVYDHDSDIWQDSPAIPDKEEAEVLRQETIKQRYTALLTSKDAS